MEIKKPGFFKRSKIILEDNKRFTNKYILTELTKLFEDLYEVKQSRILNVDIDIKKSIFSAIGINIRRKKGNLTLNFIGFIPSLWVRLSLLFTFPILIILVNLNDFNFLQLLDKIILAEFVPFIIVSLILKYRV
ncbi:MAG: hypothetical protein KDK36_18660, partial [Leptospiraceae bacterium]|nr:hypothetical protein [Leptospiraceae bacterium]